MKKTLTIISFFILLYSCNNEDDKIKSSNDIYTKSLSDINYFPIDSATIFAEKIELFNNSFSTNLNAKKTRNISVEREVKSIKIIKNSKGKESFYIISYEKGFVIISADKRVYPILAFSNSNDFKIEDSNYPEGLKYWLNMTSEGIGDIKQIKADDSVISAWKDFSNINNVISKKVPEETPDCNAYSINVGPLTKTEWGQGLGYNDLTPNLGCGWPVQNALTGCVATALAQIMYKHKKPNTFNYDLMELKEGTHNTSILMRDIGDNVKMSYGCEASSSTSSLAFNALKNYGYNNTKSADYKSDTYNLVKNELDYGRPIIVSGSNHMWIIDGYLSYVDPCWGSMLQFRMNWGWNGRFDGYYSFNNFFIDQLDTKFSPNKIIYNIY